MAAHAWSFWFVATSLVLLLRSDQLQLLGFVEKLAPLLVCRKLLVGREQGLGRRDPNSNLKLRVRLPFHCTHCGWNVPIIATDHGPINRRIETQPANAREKASTQACAAPSAEACAFSHGKRIH
jgi:hypothetical protein